MATTRIKLDTNTEKRFKQLQQQIYGGTKLNYSLNTINSSPEKLTSTNTSDMAYLKTDLIKIIVLSTIAIGVQILLYYLTSNHYLNLQVVASSLLK